MLDKVGQNRVVIGADAERAGDTACLLDRGGKNCGVRIVDRTRPYWAAGSNDLVAGRDDRDPRPPPDLDFGMPDRRQHSDLARGQNLTGAQYGFASRHVASGKSDKLSDRRGPPDFDRDVAGFLDGFGVLDHHHGVGAARHHAAGRDQGRGPGFDCEARLCPGCQYFGKQRQPARGLRASAVRVICAYRETVDAGAVETRHIDFRNDAASDDTPKSLR